MAVRVINQPQLLQGQIKIRTPFPIVVPTSITSLSTSASPSGWNKIVATDTRLIVSNNTAGSTAPNEQGTVSWQTWSGSQLSKMTAPGSGDYPAEAHPVGEFDRFGTAFAQYNGTLLVFEQGGDYESIRNYNFQQYTNLDAVNDGTVYKMSDSSNTFLSNNAYVRTSNAVLGGTWGQYLAVGPNYTVIRASEASVGGAVYIYANPALNNAARVVNPDSGVITNWGTSLATDENYVAVSASSANRVYVYTGKTTIPSQVIQGPSGSGFGSVVRFDGGLLYICCSIKDAAYVYNPATGQLVDTLPIPTQSSGWGDASTFHITSNYYVCRDNLASRLRVIDRTSKQIVAMLSSDDVLSFGSFANFDVTYSGKVVALNTAGNQAHIWQL